MSWDRNLQNANVSCLGIGEFTKSVVVNAELEALGGAISEVVAFVQRIRICSVTFDVQVAVLSGNDCRPIRLYKY
ncbi:hypothetical protein D3C72_2252310 [compost metagenome]